MGQEVALPDWAKTGKAMSTAFNALNALDDNLAAGIGQSYGVLGYKGKQWSLRYRGERKNFVRPDDGTPASYLDVIILGSPAHKAKSYYKSFVDGDSSPPICSSMDGVVPDADVTQKQSDSCALCPRNEWRTDPKTGKKGRECSDYKRLAVLVLPSQTKLILGAPLLEGVFLRVPPDSLSSLAVMGETMANQGFHYSSYITRITFDPDKAHPCMMFRPLQPLSDAEAPAVLAMRGEPIVDRIIGGGKSGVVPHAPVAGSTLVVSAPQQSAPVQVQGVQQAPVQPPPAVAPLPAPTGLVDTGLGLASPATPDPGPGTSPAVQTVADAGEPEESDADLDARIAKLVKSS